MKKSIYYHPGIYRFQFPYLGAYLGPDENNEVKVYHCDVVIKVGQEEDMRNGKLVTIIITAQDGTPGVQNFIEVIATKVRISFFDHIFIEKHWEGTVIAEDSIRWIERHLFASKTNSMMDDHINEVTMIWDRKKHKYASPTWKPVKDEIHV